MTKKQRIYLAWLVVKNLERMCHQADTRKGRRLIASAYAKRAKLNLPAWQGEMSQRDRVFDIVRTLHDLLGMDEFVFVELEDDEDPFGGGY